MDSLFNFFVFFCALEALVYVILTPQSEMGYPKSINCCYINLCDISHCRFNFCGICSNPQKLVTQINGTT